MRCLGRIHGILGGFHVAQGEDQLADFGILQENVLIDGEVLLLALAHRHIGITDGLQTTVDGIVTLQPRTVLTGSTSLQGDALDILLQDGKLSLYLSLLDLIGEVGNARRTVGHVQPLDTQALIQGRVDGLGMRHLLIEREVHLAAEELLVGHHGTIAVVFVQDIIIPIRRKTASTRLADGELVHHGLVMIIGDALGNTPKRQHGCHHPYHFYMLLHLQYPTSSVTRFHREKASLAISRRVFAR